MSESVTLQQLLHQYLPAYLSHHPLDRHRLKVCRHLQHCHTPALGGISYQCDHCHDQFPRYHGCRDRHCPQCQSRASRRWCEQQQADILPVTYHHLVFTLPHELNGWVQLHPEVIYRCLFQVVWQTLKAFAADPKRLDGQLGMTAVLHTWGQNLSQHVHLHCLIPGGALSKDKVWHAARSTYLFPVRALSRHFRGNMVSALRQSATAGQLTRVTQKHEVDERLDQLMQKDWVVYSKHCLGRSHSIVAYLARYTHRIAISDQRIIGIEDHQVAFRYKDYRNNRPGIIKLQCDEFIRRFLMHVLPKGLMRIRHYGLLANRCRKTSVAILRKLLASTPTVIEEHKTGTTADYPCPKCHQGQLRVIRILHPVWPLLVIKPG